MVKLHLGYKKGYGRTALGLKAGNYWTALGLKEKVLGCRFYLLQP